MKILALTTCSAYCSVAIQDQQHIVSRVQQTKGGGHSDHLLSMIEACLNETATHISTLDAIALSCGPGAFTGLRIGIGVAQGLAFAHDIAVVPISSLKVVAYQAGQQFGPGNYAVAVDARMGEIYSAQYYVQDHELLCIEDEKVGEPTAFLPHNDQSYYGVGTGWAVYHDILAGQFEQQLLTSDTTINPTAQGVLALAYHAIARGETVSAEQVLPTYLRNNVAKKQTEQ